MQAERPLVMFGAASNRPRLTGLLSGFIRRTRLSFFNTQMGKGTVARVAAEVGGEELWMGTAALTERDYVHEAIDKADLILAIGHDTIEKPPFIMGPNGPKVIHVWRTRRRMSSRSTSRMPKSSATSVRASRCWPTGSRASCPMPVRWCRCATPSCAARSARADESRFPLTPQRIVATCAR